MGLRSVTPEEMWSGRRPCVAHMHVFGSLTYAMVPNNKRDTLDEKGIKCVFLEYCEGMKVYRLMCLKTQKKNHKNKDDVFIEDSGSVRNDWR